MDMRSLIHQGSSPRGDERGSSASASASAGGYATSTAAMSRPMTMPLPVSGYAQMRQAPTIFHRQQQQQQQQPAPTLAPLRFIIPSSMSGGFAHSAAVSSTASESRAAPYQTREPELEPRPQQNSILAFDEAFRMDQQQHQQQLQTASSAAFPTSSTASGSAMTPGETMDSKDGVKQAPKTKKPSSKRARQPKNSSRSTKSKARPGLRKGKWTEEESRYAAQLTNYFKEGLLPLERGTMLRLYLSQKLNCEPMRITKKFTGGECIGKQVFRPCSPTPESRVRLMQAQLELVALEAAFIKRVKENREEAPVATDEFDAAGASTLAAAASVNSAPKPRPVLLKPRGDVKTEDDSSYGTDSNRPLYPSPAQGSAAMYAPSMPTGPQGCSAVSVKTEKGDVDDASAVGLLLDFFYKANRNEASSAQIDAASCKPQQQQQQQMTKETPAVASPAAGGERDEAIASPTKRMRALSVSKYSSDSTTAKRSRVGSFTVCA